MIVFNKLNFKNFLSVGNAPIEIDLKNSKKVLITGQNGHGKSTILNALSFVLFNRPIKALNKGGLVNSINNKNCLVEIDFTIGSKHYLVKRGIKPNIFEIYEDSKLLDQTAVLDYQEHLESKILQSNFRAFTQTTVISIENYIPFMKLRSHERREFIEELLDIKVFSTMNTLLKSKMNEVKDELKLLETKLKLTKEKAILQKKHIEQIENLRDEQVKEIEEKIRQYEDEITGLTIDIRESNTRHDVLIAELEELERQQLTAEKYIKAKDQLDATLDGIIESYNFYHDAENCPTCKQDINSNHREELLSAATEKKVKLETAISDVQNKLLSLSDVNAKITEKNKECRAINSAVHSAHSSISQFHKLIKQCRDDIFKCENQNESLTEQKELLKGIASEAIVLSKTKADLSEQSQYQDIAYGLLKDSGIKAKIIKQYIPIINKYVNKYLAEMDFFVSFELDENFNETIKSRHRDTFTYFNFSAGEQQRVDLAMMMTWRQIAKMKNSFNSNILFLDEVLDRVDAVGFDLLINIFSSSEMDSTNIFVVSHKPKDTLAEIFNTLIEMKKDKHGFSEAILG